MSGDYKDRMTEYITRQATNIRRKVTDGHSNDHDDEEFEVLDLTTRNWVQTVMKDLSKASVAKQLTVGGVSGWCSGYLFGKVGKAAALATGGSLLLLQIAHHQGYITVNWGKLEKNLKTARRQLEQQARSRLPGVAEEVRDFIAANVFLAGGFAGGFLLGLAS